MVYTFKPQGVCPREILIELDENNIVRKIEASGGCSGNLQGLSRLAEGSSAQDVIRRLKGIRCSFKSTSCPDQIAVNLEQYLNEHSKA